jgi:protein-S-isoprenylcysteine O-methyltransferase Ste14
MMRCQEQQSRANSRQPPVQQLRIRNMISAVSFSGLLIYWAALESFVLLHETVLKKKTFRNDPTLKVFLPLIFFSLAFPAVARLAAIPFPKWTAPVSALILMGLGLLIRTAAIVGLRHNFSLSIDESNTESIVTSGLYAYIRHPSYLGSIICFSGYALWCAPVTAPIVCGAVLTAHLIRIQHEEQYLQTRFGMMYTVYMHRTKKLIPFIF